MKKRIIFAFLFTFIFASSALAVPDLSECETLEDAYEMGYYNRLLEEYECNTAEGKCSASDSYMLYGIICRLYENNAFIEYSGDPEVDEYSLSEAYGDGYSTAGGDFTELYAELKHETENQPEPLTPEDAKDSYDEGYQAGYSDGKSQSDSKSQYEYTPDETEEESDEITDILILCGLGCIIGIIIGYFICKKADRNIPKPYSTPSKTDYSSIRTAPAHSDFSVPEPLPRHTEPQPNRASVDLFTPASPPARRPSTQPKRSNAVIHKKSTKEAFHSYISIKECEQLPLAQAHQLALDRYNQRNRNDWEVGLDFERLIGYQYEIRGYMVKYIGATSGKEDMGRDLIVSNDKNTYIVQCKRWSRNSQIYEKYIFQLYGTTELYKKQHPIGSVSAVFVTTSYFSAQAKAAASSLGIELIEHYSFHLHPLIKCKADTGQYYLPMDSDYDKISISFASGDCYHKTVKAAISAGFQSAYQ